MVLRKRLEVIKKYCLAITEAKTLSFYIKAKYQRICFVFERQMSMNNLQKSWEEADKIMTGKVENRLVKL